MEAPQVGLGCATLFAAGLVDLIEVAARHQFATITVRPASFLDAIGSGESEQGLRRRLGDAGIAVRVIDGLSRALPGEWLLDPDDPKLSHLPREVFNPPSEEDCLRAAEALEAPLLSVAHFGHAPVPAEQLVDVVGALCRRAAARGIGITLEFVPGTGMSDVTTTDWIVRSCGEPNCGVLLDPWHWSRSGGTLDDVRKLAPGALNALQLCDRIPELAGTPYTPMSGRDMPGEGELPLYELVEAALANSPGITIEAEVINAGLNAMSFDDAAASLAKAVATWRAGYGT
ncbi:MAG: sugar phosphate isomerase/epimerase [Novosphingobium sp.]|nr:sugar phosphate isomerase/epimerase [Novosphingobium sp.]